MHKLSRTKILLRSKLKIQRYDIFISYQWDSQPQVMKIKDFLTRNGYQIWMDLECLHGGLNLPDNLCEAIKGSQIFLACITKQYSLSQMCKKELHFALQLKKVVIPLMLENNELVALHGVGFVIADLLRINVYSDDSWQGSISEQLLRSIKENIDDVKRNQNNNEEVKTTPAKPFTSDKLYDITKLLKKEKSIYEHSKRTSKPDEHFDFSNLNNEVYKMMYSPEEKDNSVDISKVSKSDEENQDIEDSFAVISLNEGYSLLREEKIDDDDYYSTDIVPDHKNKRLIYTNGEYTGSVYQRTRYGKGTMKYSNGAKYVGEWKDDKMHGYGKYYFEDGDFYEGQWKDDMMCGKGSWYYNNSSQKNERYEGEFKDDKYHGQGTYYYYDGSRYEGEWIYGKKNAYGVFYYANGSRYEGEWKDDNKWGYGRFFFEVRPWKGDCYEGEWKDNCKEGKGVYNYANGNKYDGEWVNDFQKGFGIFYFAVKPNKGDRYEGNWEDGVKSGKGVYYFANGDKYEGKWVNDKIQGKGIRTYNNGDKYDGDWKDGLKNGKGIQYFSNGDRYEGFWRNSQMDGKGIFYRSNKNRIEAEWNKDRVFGKCFIYYYNGDKYEGEVEGFKRDGKGVLHSKGDKFEGEWKDDLMIDFGNCSFANGDKYKGFWKDGKMDGRGVLTYLNGDQYDGNWINGMKHGNGVLTIYETNQTVKQTWAEDKLISSK